MALLVSFTKKTTSGDPYTRVTALCGKRRDGSFWEQPIELAIAEIEAATQTYYVNVNGFTPNLTVAEHKGRKYLKTDFDRDGPATLLGLPSFESAPEADRSH
jgi:hypothetical protein